MVDLNYARPFEISRRIAQGNSGVWRSLCGRGQSNQLKALAGGGALAV